MVRKLSLSHGNVLSSSAGWTGASASSGLSVAGMTGCGTIPGEVLSASDLAGESMAVVRTWEMLPQ